MKIGYELTRSGKRQRKWWYFAGDHTTNPPPEVVADAVAKQREWQTLKTNWATLSPTLAQLDPDSDYSLPVWYDKDWFASVTNPSEREREEIEKARKVDASYKTRYAVDDLKQAAQLGSTPSQIIDTLREAGLLPRGVQAPTRQPTIRQAINEYLDYQEKRLGLRIGNVIKVGTFNTIRNNLLISVGLTCSAEPTEAAKIIDLDKPLVGLNSKDIEAIAVHWFSQAGMRHRTIKNYFTEFKGFLRWAEEQDDLGFLAPRNVRKTLFIAGGNGHSEVTPVDYEALKTLLEKTRSKSVKLWAFFGLFCGFYQADISNLTVDEVEKIEGEYYITGYRSKEDAESKIDHKIKVTTWVPPEMAAIMLDMKAPNNQWRMWFLNSHGQPLFREKLKGGRQSNVGEQWHRAAPDIQFKQLRKWGWNEIQRHGSDKVCSGITLARRWAGQAGGGVSAAYQFQDYKPVIEAQRQWWNHLRTVFGL